ncbi:MAG TPA: Holliday junction branch migration protein RuvA [Bacteroidales bacterium]|nr:Holliday junction branch migration protein RuvA [Bacteroidales bacterium]
MIEYIKGKLISKKPTYVIIEASGIGYMVNISLNTYSKIDDKSDELLLLIHSVIREDAHLLYGFYDENERTLFRQLLSVSGVGANTARMILSSVDACQLTDAIVKENVKILQSIKGIGLKTAQRIIVDLKDKINKTDTLSEKVIDKNNTIKNEALYALTLLGFPLSAAKKAVDFVCEQQTESFSVEELIKQSLKIL